MKKFQGFYAVIVLLFLGIFLRLTAFNNWNLGFDQVQILEAVDKISKGDLTLIGPRTGPATLFTGPLIYYLTAIFYLFGFSYYSLIACTIFISIITFLTIYLLLKKYFNERFAIIGVFLWTFSSNLIRNDQVTWNPNLTILAASLLFFPLIASFGNKKFSIVDYLLILIGGFLSYQAHFSGFLFLPLSVLLFLNKNKIQALKLFFAHLVGFVLSFLPTIVFDYRNNWLNLKGILEFFNNLEFKDIDNPYTYHLWKSFYTTFESLGAIFFSNFSLPIQILFIFGLILFSFYIYFLFKEKIFLSLGHLIPIIWISMVTLTLSFYGGDKPSYYFLLQIPAFLMIHVYLFDHLKDKFDYFFILILFMILAFSHSISAFFIKNPFSLNNALRTKKYIEKQSAHIGINKLFFHLPIGEDMGLKYILSNLETLNKDGYDWYLSYPNSVAFSSATLNNMHVWAQNATRDDENLYFSDEFRIITPSSIYVYRNQYYSGSADQGYIVFEDGIQVASMEKYSIKFFKQDFKNLDLKSHDDWQLINNQTAVYHYKLSDSVFLLTTFKQADLIYENIRIF